MMMNPIVLISILLSIGLSEITVTGPLVDLYCWDTLKGRALDTGKNLTLDPYKHTVHCMIDVGVCKNSGFAIVYKPVNATKYEVQYYLDAAGNALAIEALSQVPISEKNDQVGFEFTITGIPNNNDPPTLITSGISTTLPMTTSMAGDVLKVTGPLVDLYCWDTRNGIAWDTGKDLRVDPYKHTVHCLVEVGVCKNSGFAFVHKPDGVDQYQIQYYLDDAGNALAITEMEKVPSGNRNAQVGFEFTICGIPNNEDPPKLITADCTSETQGDDGNIVDMGIGCIVMIMMVAMNAF